MIGRIVITSVPQGLDGGTGFQPVLRTQGLNPSIAKRLALRASYAHPYDFGHPRNPRVLFHRIETVGDRNIHVLGSVRDAGSSYTGRSNHLAELIAIDPAETRGLPGGPVFACRTFPWLGNWAGEPREVPIAEEPGVPANDPDDPAASGRSEPCVAWAAATGDPGWAGELAQSFLDGRRAVVWVNEGVDAAALFAEAMRLLPVSSRWQVEFNTCEIEPFAAHWRGLRPDIMLVGPRPGHGGELVLNLSDIKRNSERSPDHALAHRARGESTARASTGGSDATQTAGTWPTGGQGFSETPAGTMTSVADEAAIRARLKEFRDSRPRRSPHDPVLPRSEQPGDGLGVSSILFLVGCVVLCGFLVSASVVTILHPELTRSLVDRARANVGVGGGNVADGSAIALRSPTETAENLAKKKIEKAEQEAQKKADEEAARIAEAEKRERDEAEKARRKQEMADRESADKRKEEAATRDKAAASEAAIKAFRSVEEIRTIPLTQTFPDRVLCPFDTEHLRDAACDLAYIRPEPIDSETVRMSVQRSPAADDQPPTWTVTGSQYDPLSQSWGKPVTVCRLVVRNRMLRLEWPTPEISPEHALFRTMENGAVIVSCKTAAGDAEICREIRFAEPIDLATSGKDTITLDPLAGSDPKAGKDEASFDPTLAKRLEVIEPSALRWSLEVIHPQWTAPEQLRRPDTQLTVHLPSKPLPGVAIGYLDFDAKSKSLVKRASDMRLDSTLTFSQREARLKVESQMTGIDTVPLLNSVITVEALRNAFRETDGLEPLENAVQKVLVNNSKNERYRHSALNAFLQESKLAKELRVADADAFTLRALQLENERKSIRIPGQFYPNELGAGKILYDNENKYNAEMNEWRPKSDKLKALLADFEEDWSKKTNDAVADIKTALKKNAKWFDPITITIQSLSAIATDSKGGKYPISIVKTPKK